MEEKLKVLKSILYEIYDLNAAYALLDWDQNTYMPPGGVTERGNQLATLARLSHTKSTSDEMGGLLSDLETNAMELDPDSDDSCMIKLTKREYDKNLRIPSQFVAEMAMVTSAANNAWRKARQDADFDQFKGHLEKIVAMGRQYADFFAPYDHIYDPLLDEYEPGMKTAEVQQIFNVLRREQVELIKAIVDKPQVDDGFLYQYFPENDQWDFGVEVVTRLGYDWQRGRQDVTAHPFSTSFGLNDVRITTRFDPNHGVSALFGSIHECGHALYEMGIDPAIQRTFIAHGASGAFHESQSRLFENLIGRSLPFWKHFYPRMKERFTSQLGNVDLSAFYRGINRVDPSFIRVNADEATYNLHIMLRLEIEIDLFEGTIAVVDLPDVWNDRMDKYLGITPPNAAMGVLQDIHWAMGLVGYFSSYALGNLISVQIWERMEQDIANVNELIEKGEFSVMLEWLQNNVHRHGKKYQPQQLIYKITGSKIDPQPYIRYLKKKYGQIYQL
jgi:carboxypeptidase Taq